MWQPVWASIMINKTVEGMLKRLHYTCKLNTFTGHIYDAGFVSGICKEHSKFNNKKTAYIF